MRSTSTLLALLLALAIPTAAPAEDKPKQFRAGAATSVTTPPLGVSINGGMQDRHATHVHDELHARCLVLDDGGTKLAIVVTDMCMIPRPVLDEAKALAEERTGIPASHMLVSATHAHSAPTGGPTFQSNPDPDYLHFLARRIADGIARADNNLAPAKIGWGVGKVADQVFNRRWKLKPGTAMPDPFGGMDQVKMNPGIGNPALLEPAGPTDPETPVVSLRSLDGKPLAVLANYSLHYVGGVPANEISADYYGAFAERLEQIMNAEHQDPPFVGIMSNGTSGDINNVNVTGPKLTQKPYEQIHVVANEVATEVARVCAGLEYHDWVPLGVREQEIRLGVRKPTSDDLARAQEKLAHAKNPKKLDTIDELYAMETVEMTKFPAEMPILLQAMRIGDLAITAIPCEVFVQTGLNLKAKSALKPMFNIELANGYNGYLPTPEQHRLGGYETWRARSSYLETEASTKIAATLLGLIEQLK